MTEVDNITEIGQIADRFRRSHTEADISLNKTIGEEISGEETGNFKNNRFDIC